MCASVFQHDVVNNRQPGENVGDNDPDWTAAVHTFFKENVSRDMSGIPSLNTTPVHQLSDGQLVTFRCMIQVWQALHLQTLPQDIYLIQAFLGVLPVADTFI